MERCVVIVAASLPVVFLAGCAKTCPYSAVEKCCADHLEDCRDLSSSYPGKPQFHPEMDNPQFADWPRQAGVVDKADCARFKRYTKCMNDISCCEAREEPYRLYGDGINDWW